MLLAADFRKEAWNKLSGKWGTAAVITLIFLAISGATVSLTFIGIGAIAGILISGPLTVGYSIMALSIIRMQDIKISYLFDGFKNFLNGFVLYILNNLFIFLWSLLFIVPGIIKTYAYSMSYFILADNPDMAPNEARKESMRLMQGNKWRLFCLDFSFIGWALLTALKLGILSFWVSPYMESAHAAFYESIRPKNAPLEQ